MSKTTITSASSRKLNLKELFDYRDLFWVLAYRDLRVRYAQTFLGLLWAILQPLSTLLIFTLIFGRAIKVDTGNIPYPLFALCGMSAWSYFAFVMNQSGTSIIGAQEMIKKIYFPRLVIPLSKSLVAFVDFGIALAMTIVLLFYYNIPITPSIFIFPVFVLLNILFALGVGIWLSSLTIRYRDFQHIVPFLVQLGLYASPIAYPAALIPEKYKVLYYLNPMSGIVEGFRWAILNTPPPGVYSLISFGLVFIIFFSGLWYFKKMERTMADLI
ncbi:ABC transporter permease [Reichenbachiella sp. MALMAid0571]|uniref:ABC transporter permease n=1 Tax=Reichenbachiella sp. MALMAid0571 TaxID=3143939 RepID=UPI0032E0402E